MLRETACEVCGGVATGVGRVCDECGGRGGCVWAVVGGRVVAGVTMACSRQRVWRDGG